MSIKCAMWHGKKVGKYVVDKKKGNTPYEFPEKNYVSIIRAKTCVISFMQIFF